MAITNLEAIRFVNEQVRPLCEKVRALVAEISAAEPLWYGGINGMFPNDDSAVEDGRDGEGVSRLTGQHINSAMSVLLAMKAASNSEIIAKPCVRPLIAQ